jgi:hypothetical protein
VLRKGKQPGSCWRVIWAKKSHCENRHRFLVGQKWSSSHLLQGFQRSLPYKWFWPPLILRGSAISAGTIHDLRRVKVPDIGPLWNPCKRWLELHFWPTRKRCRFSQCDFFAQITLQHEPGCLPFRSTWVHPRFLVGFLLLDLEFYMYVL